MLKSMLKDYKVCGVSIFVRLLSVYVVDSFFVPDEYYQSVEVAHHMVYGYGYLTWEWTQGIRSYIYPLIIAFLYSLLRLLRLDSSYPWLLVYFPRIIQAVVSSFADLGFFWWTGSNYWAFFCLVTSWFWFFTASRTLINTVECCLTIATIKLFPWPGSGIDPSSSVFMDIVALLFVMRPTGVIFFIPLILYHLVMNRNIIKKIMWDSYLRICGWVLVGSIVIDSLAHGSFVVTPYEFIKVNFFKDIGSFYGVHTWYWYFVAGIPVVLGVQVIPFVLGLIKFVRNREAYHKELVILGSMAFTVAVYSYMPHKEFRFLLPLLPLAMYIASKYLSIWSRTASRWEVWTVVIFMLVGNAIPAVYFSMVHQTGPMNIIRALRPMLYDCPEDTSLLFLMPCHSTPMYSHLHKNVSVRMLTCEPNFDNLPGYKDESAIFYECPHCWIDKNYPNIKSMPTYIITYKGFDMRIINRLGSYDPVFRTFHSHLPDPRREGRDMIIYRKEYYILR